MSVAKLIPHSHFAEVHAIDIAAPIDIVWNKFTQFDMFSSPLIQLLFKLRGITLDPTPTPTFSGWDDSWSLVNDMFQPVTKVPPKLLTLTIRNDDLGRYREIDIAWDFRFIAITADQTRVVTETRVFISDSLVRFRRLFRIYWTIIRIPSGAIRLEILRKLKEFVE